MAEIVRTFPFPPDLSADKIQQLSQSLQSLPIKQKQLHKVDQAVAVATGVERTVNSFEVRYEIEQFRSVADLLSDSPPDHDTLLAWAKQLSQILSAVYTTDKSTSAGHGGICAESVVITSPNELKVLDFGVSDCFKAVLDPSDESWLANVAGYVAPELWNSPSRITQQTDVFAVGVLLYELAVGRHPFGADRDDADDCKYKMLIEVPLPPHKRDSNLDETLSNIIFHAIQTETDRRYPTFERMLKDLEEYSCTFAGAVIDEQTPVTVERKDSEPPLPEAVPSEPEAGTPEQEVVEPGEDKDSVARQKYLEDQTRLRREREEAELRQDKLRQHAQQVKTTVKKHALILSSTLLGLIMVVAAVTMVMVRSSNARAVEDTLGVLAGRLNDHFTRTDGLAMAKSLGISSPSSRLQGAVADLNKVAPHTKFSFENPAYLNFKRTTGQVVLKLGEAAIQMAFELDDSARDRLQFDLTDQKFADSVIKAVETLALSQLSTQVRDLMARIKAIFGEAETAAEAESKLNDLLTATALQKASTQGSLRYLSFQGERKSIKLGSLKPVPGEEAVQSQVALTSLSGEDILSVPPKVILGYVCEAGSPGCMLADITVEPSVEPEEHKRWCIESTIRQIRRAFESGEAAQLAKCVQETESSRIEETFDWIKQCKSATLSFKPINLDSATVQATIRYVPGILNDKAYETGLLGFAFDGDREWRLQYGGRNDWPTAPLSLLRQQRGKTLIEQFRQAWAERDSAKYLALFEGTRRDEQSIAEMFAKISEDQVRFEITAREDEKSETVLYLDIVPQVNDEKLAAEYQTRTFGFRLEGDMLNWDRRSDPLWIFAGLSYQNFVKRLRNSDWSIFSQIKHDFEQTHEEDMSAGERSELESWISAVDEARDLFNPVSESYLSGFPERVQLGKSPNELPMVFRLVPIPGPPPYLMYVQEREVRVSDITRYWRRVDKPWEMWRRIVGPPPHEQVVGLTLAEAQEFALYHGCSIPTQPEWFEAARQFGESPDKTAETEYAFYGGVWEFCSDGEEGQPPTIVGGSWYDYDPKLIAAGVQLPGQRAGMVARQSRFGTVGFRLCKRLFVPEAVVSLEGGAAGATSSAEP